MNPSSSPAPPGSSASNFVRYWVEQHPGDHVVALDALTYAGIPREPRRSRRRHVRAGRHRRPRRLVEQVLERARDRRDRQLRGRVAQQPGDPRSRRGSSAPTCSAPRRCARRPGGSASARFHHVSTCEVYGDLVARHRRDVRPRTSPYRPRTPYNASKAGGDHVVRAYHETFGPADHDHQLRQQLRAVPVPREGDPAASPRRRSRTSRCRCTRRPQNRREWIHVLDHCRAIDVILERRPDRRDVPRRHRRRAEHRADRRHRARRISASRSR